MKQIESKEQARAAEKLFNAARKEQLEKRRAAVGTLTPGQFRKYLSSGATLDLIFGVKKDGTPFTADDLREFDRKARSARKRYKSTKKGVPAAQLMAASLSSDLKRSRDHIKRATFYRVFNSRDGVLLHFSTSSGPESKKDSHQVKIRLDEWTEHLTGNLPFPEAAKKILGGRISFDCDCGRHQFWYRYVATIGGFAVAPLENAYPKIRNPRLIGACCKHVLKVLATLQGPAVQKLVIGEMKKAADQIGYGDDVKVANRFLSKDELQTAARSSANMEAPTSKVAKEMYRKYKAAHKGLKKKMKEAETKEFMRQKEVELEVFKKTARVEVKKRKQLEADLSKEKLKSALNTALLVAVYRDKIPKERAMADFAAQNKLSEAEVAELAVGLSV